jgi:hypothetical protein
VSWRWRRVALHGSTIGAVLVYVWVTWLTFAAEPGRATQAMSIWHRTAATVVGSLFVASLIVTVKVPEWQCYRAGVESGREQRTDTEPRLLRMVRGSTQ